MFKLLIIVAIIVAILLILIVLVQNSKGGGLSSQFGGSGANQVIGVKKTTDLLEKITWTLVIVLFVLSLSSNFLIDNSSNTLPDNPNINRAVEQAPVNTGQTPASEGTGLESLQPDSAQ